MLPRHSSPHLLVVQPEFTLWLGMVSPLPLLFNLFCLILGLSFESVVADASADSGSNHSILVNWNISNNNISSSGNLVISPTSNYSSTTAATTTAATTTAATTTAATTTAATTTAATTTTRTVPPSTSTTTTKSKDATTKMSTTTAAALTTTTMSAASSSQQLKYSVVLPLCALCTFFQLYVTIFGRRMRMAGIRWFTLYYNLWNFYQLVLISDTADGSPWRGWLGNSQMLVGKASLELFTMSFFPLGVVFVVPLLLLSHFCFCCPLRWCLWVPLFLLCSLLPTLLFNGGLIFAVPVAKGNLTVATTVNDTVPMDAVELYAFVSISLALLSTVYLVPMVLVATFFFLCYRLLNRFNPKSNHSLRTSRVVDLLMLLPFLLVVIVVHLPTFIVNLSGFFIVQIYPSLAPTLIPLLTGTGGGVGGGGGGGAPSNTTAAPVNPLTSAWMMDVLNAYNNVLMYKDDSMLLLPLVEFVGSIIFIRMYREQYISLLCCNACYKEDMDGACCVCCFKKRRPLGTVAVAPIVLAQQQVQDPQLWAQPVLHKK